MARHRPPARGAVGSRAVTSAGGCFPAGQWLKVPANRRRGTCSWFPHRPPPRRNSFPLSRAIPLKAALACHFTPDPGYPQSCSQVCNSVDVIFLQVAVPAGPTCGFVLCTSGPNLLINPGINDRKLWMPRTGGKNSTETPACPHFLHTVTHSGKYGATCPNSPIPQFQQDLLYLPEISSRRSSGEKSVVESKCEAYCFPSAPAGEETGRRNVFQPTGRPGSFDLGTQSGRGIRVKSHPVTGIMDFRRLCPTNVCSDLGA